MQDSFQLGLLYWLFAIFSCFTTFFIIRPFLKFSAKNRSLRTLADERILQGVILIFLSITFFYTKFGGLSEYYAYKASAKSKQEAMLILKKFKNTPELIDKLRNHLKSHPNSSKGWFLLGRLYVSQNELQPALKAFTRAYNLDSKNAAIILNYASLLIAMGDEKKGINLLIALVKDNHKQQDALSILAMNAYKNEDFAGAIMYWQTLLNTLPAQSEEADLIRLAIAKAFRQSKKSES